MAGKVITIDTGYKPRIHQAWLHTKLNRFNVIVCHRRFGKTHFAVMEMLDQLLRCDLKAPQAAYLAPTYSQAKRVVWNILKAYAENIPGYECNESDLRVTIPRPAMKDKVTILLLGAENPGALKGVYLDYVVLDEFGEQNPQVWSEAIRPALSDRKGKALFIGTAKGQNHFWDMYNQASDKPDWFRAMFKASETNIIDPEELRSAQEVMSDAEYNQEYECSFAAALVGAYFGKEIEKIEEKKQVTKVPHDPALTTKVYFDLGMDDSTAIWFTQNLGGREVRVIDYIEESGQGLDYYADLIRKKGYSYEEIVLPHDGAVREMGTGKSRLETLKTLLRGTRVRVGKKHRVEDSINAARLLLAKCWFDKDNCARGINSLKNYRREWDAKTKTFSNKPKHDWSSHGADAFRLLAMEINENGPTAEDRARYPRYADSKFDVV